MSTARLYNTLSRSALARSALHGRPRLPSQRLYSSASLAGRELNLPINYETSTLLNHTSAKALAHHELSADAKQQTTKRMNLYQAINDGMAHILERDEKACVFGEDVAFGGK